MGINCAMGDFNGSATFRGGDRMEITVLLYAADSVLTCESEQHLRVKIGHFVDYVKGKQKIQKNKIK